MIEFIITLIKSFFNKKQQVVEQQDEKNMIDWKNPKSKISKYFTVHEATYLPSWSCYHDPSEEEKKEIIKLANIMDIIRERIGKSIIVHVWMRPKSVNCEDHERHGQDYNLFIGSKSTKSGHIFGQAVDFHVSGMTDFNAVRKMVIPWLEELNIRMEDIQGNWIHIDTKPVGSKRFFKP